MRQLSPFSSVPEREREREREIVRVRVVVGVLLCVLSTRLAGRFSTMRLSVDLATLFFASSRLGLTLRRRMGKECPLVRRSGR
jgi:hypothetical protein